jgi:hypothetical protein
LTEKLTAWHREDVPFHIWLISPTFEVLDVTFAVIIGWARAREECERLILYKEAHSSGDPIYHPTLVGEDFFLMTAVMI